MILCGEAKGVSDEKDEMAKSGDASVPDGNWDDKSRCYHYKTTSAVGSTFAIFRWISSTLNFE